jgi:hypothetical protein
MATTINTSDLDFNNIKTSLKTFLKRQTEFSDYDFEASGLSNILDVLAYNTHINALVANFTLNESFLGTAQLRSSLVSLATGIGYIPDSKTASRGLITITLDLSGVASPPASLQLPAFFRFSAVVDDITYTFQTIENYTATNNNGIYRFTTTEGSTSIPILEGTRKTKNFNVGEFNEADVYVIPDVDLDVDTTTVDFFESPSSTEFTSFTNIIDITSVNENSTIFILKEAPNGFYQLSFGNNGILGQSPTAGGLIEVNYLSTRAALANGAGTFTPIDTVIVDGQTFTPTVGLVSRSTGGDDKESIESIRTNAPFQYASQNRMVTAEDYQAIILRNYSTLISDIKTYGGQDDPSPKFGTVFTSILFEDDVDAETQANTKTGIRNLVDQLAVLAFGVEFKDPLETFVQANVVFQVNPELTPLSINTIKGQVDTAIANYFSNAIGGFDQSFRRSNLLTLIDAVSPAVLSSRANIKMQQRFTPTLNATNKVTLNFPAAIDIPRTTSTSVISTTYTLGDETVRIQNTSGSSNLEVVNAGTNEVVVDSVGSYNQLSGQVIITGLRVDDITGASLLKISCVPANQSAISPVRENLLKFDAEISDTKYVLTEADN